MPLPINDVLGILSDNLGKRNGALPISSRKATAWARGLDIPMGGETVLYTGQMYQLIPSINTLAGQMARFEDSWVTSYFGLGRAVNKVMNLSMFMTLGSNSEQREYNSFVRNIAILLRAAGVDFGYLYEKELYTGALLYDQGVDGVFEDQAGRVYETIKKHGVKRLITIDPHTTNMLRTVYPGIISEYDIEVKSYLEVLAELDIDAVKPVELDLVIHDSCIYARHERVVEEPRILLQGAGAKLRESEYSRKFTHCCGGPLEVLFPGKSHLVATNRLEQLARCGNRVVTMCPICMAGLRRCSGPDMQINDISEYLVQAYCGTETTEVREKEPVLA